MARREEEIGKEKERKKDWTERGAAMAFIIEWALVQMKESFFWDGVANEWPWNEGKTDHCIEWASFPVFPVCRWYDGCLSFLLQIYINLTQRVWAYHQAQMMPSRTCYSLDMLTLKVAIHHRFTVFSIICTTIQAGRRWGGGRIDKVRYRIRLYQCLACTN